MSLHARKPEPAPEETARVARAAFPRGNAYIRMRDELDTIYEDEQFERLFPHRGQPAESPWRLALVTIFQFAENLSDREAADTVRARIDWKYALSLELTDTGFDSSVLSEFRSRLVEGRAERLLLEVMLERFRRQGLLRARGGQRTDSTHVLAAVRGINRFELVREAMRHALESLSVAAPDWLKAHADPEWVERYERHFEKRPGKGKQAQLELARVIGADGATLLRAVHSSDAREWMRQVPAVETLRLVWLQNYYSVGDEVRWRTAEEEGIPPSSLFLSSPYDPDAHYGRKRTTSWIGYKAHLTETCDDDLPHVITNVETTPATAADGEVTPKVHQELREKGLLPEKHIVDTGYLDAELIVDSRRQYGVELLGPTRSDRRWQTRAAGGFGMEHFVVDFERRKATCPEGRESLEWAPRVDNRGNDSIYIRFSPSDCGPCSSRTNCTRSARKYPRRSIAVRPQEQYEALRARRQQEKTAEYAKEYSKRAGIEGTISQGVRALGLRRSRYIGLAKTHLDHALTAAAIDFLRVADWLAGCPPAPTRRSHFSLLMAQ
jgi:transposase